MTKAEPRTKTAVAPARAPLVLRHSAFGLLSSFVIRHCEDGGSAVGQRIERDHQRFRKLVRGKVKSNLSKYISRGEMIGKKGKDLVSIPLPQIEVPQFRYGQKGAGGAGQGDGDVGTPLGPGQPGKGSGA